ncbi:hypothetical protein ACVME8_002031 [Bradyrhizobium diazoefficiens]
MEQGVSMAQQLYFDQKDVREIEKDRNEKFKPRAFADNAKRAQRARASLIA